MHASGLLIDVFCKGKDSIPTDEDEILRIAADSLDWYAEEGNGIGDVELDSNGENPNAMCRGYLIGSKGRFCPFPDGTYMKEISEAIEDIKSTPIGIGVVVCNLFGGWMQAGLDFRPGNEMNVIERAAAEMAREYSIELEEGGCIVGIKFDAGTFD